MSWRKVCVLTSKGAPYFFKYNLFLFSNCLLSFLVFWPSVFFFFRFGCMSTSPWSMLLRSILWITNLVTIVIGAWWTSSLMREDLLKLLKVSNLRTLSGPLHNGGSAMWPLIPSIEVLLCWLPCRKLLSTILHASSVNGVAFNPFRKKWNHAMLILGPIASWIAWLIPGRGARGSWTSWRHVLCIRIIHMPSGLKKISVGLLMLLLTLTKRGARPWVFLILRGMKVKGVQMWRELNMMSPPCSPWQLSFIYFKSFKFSTFN